MSIPLLISMVISLITSAFVGMYALFLSKSRCKPQFIMFSSGVFSYILGAILEKTAESASGAMNGLVLQYVGSMTATVMLMFFIFAYFKIRLPRILSVLIVGIGVSAVVLVATTIHTNLFYSSFEFNLATRVLEIEYGPAYIIPRVLLISVLLSILTVVTKTALKQKRFSPLLKLLTAAAIGPALADVVYLSVFLNSGVNPTVYTMLIMNSLLFIAITKFNLLDISSMAMTKALNSISDAYILLDTNMKYMGANHAALHLFPELSSLDKHRSITEIKNFPNVLTELNTRGIAQNAVFSIPGKGRRLSHYRADTAELLSKKGKAIGTILLIHDITESVNLTEQLEIAAHRDALTGLYSRLHFMELSKILIKKIKRTNNKFYCLMTDLDFFKKVNDNYGHLAGDAVLKSAARVAMNAVSPYEVFGRYGGEEFILFIDESDENKVLETAEKLRAEIEATPVDYDNIQINITVSIGVSGSGANLNEDIETVIKRADEALYRAKESGRNRVAVN